MGCRILVVDDAIFFRRLIRARLEAEEGFVVVGEARDGKEAIQLAGDLRPDVVVMDGSMPLLDGVDALPAIKRAAPGCRVVFLASERSVRDQALRAGADAALNKSDSLQVCVDEIAVVHSSTPARSPVS